MWKLYSFRMFREQTLNYSVGSIGFMIEKISFCLDFCVFLMKKCIFRNSPLFATSGISVKLADGCQVDAGFLTGSQSVDGLRDTRSLV